MLILCDYNTRYLLTDLTTLTDLIWPDLFDNSQWLNILTLAHEKCFFQQQREHIWVPQQKPEVLQNWLSKTPCWYCLLFFLNIWLNQENLVSCFTGLCSLLCPDHMVQRKKNKRTLGPELQLVFPIIAENLDLHNMSMDGTSNSHRNVQ